MRVDWGLYFKEFSRLHGGQPVVYRADPESGRGGFLLFRDGWMYGRSHPSGPEYRPESEEDALVKTRAYWMVKAGVLELEARRLEDEIRELTKLQATRSAPLMTTVGYYTEDDDGKRVRATRTEPVDFQLLIDRLRMLREELAECQGMIDRPEVPKLGPADQRWTPAEIVAEIEKHSNGV